MEVSLTLLSALSYLPGLAGKFNIQLKIKMLQKLPVKGKLLWLGTLFLKQLIDYAFIYPSIEMHFICPASEGPRGIKGPFAGFNIQLKMLQKLLVIGKLLWLGTLFPKQLIKRFFLFFTFNYLIFRLELLGTLFPKQLIKCFSLSCCSILITSNL